MADFKVGDLVKKVRGPSHVGHQGWIKKVFLSKGLDTLGAVTLYVTGVPDKGESNRFPGQRYDGWDASSWEKVVPTGEDRCVTDKAPQNDEEMA